MSESKFIENKLIFISGAPRSGTTWLGKLLSLASSRIRLIDGEPFNPTFSQVMFGMEWPSWYYYLDKDRDKQLILQLSNALNLEWSTSDLWRRMRSNYAADGSIRGYFRAIKLCLQYFDKNSYILIKDPIGIFSCAQIDDLYAPKMLIIIKHPAAFVSSMLRVKWGFNFQSLLDQEDLMRNHLAEFKDEMQWYSMKSYDYDLFRKSILLWSIFSSMILGYRQDKPDWMFVRHEDVAREPASHVMKILNTWELPARNDFCDAIKKYTENTLSVESAPQIIHEMRRNSSEQVNIWKSRLSSSQINTIQEQTCKIWTQFYTASDW